VPAAAPLHVPGVSASRPVSDVDAREWLNPRARRRGGEVVVLSPIDVVDVVVDGTVDDGSVVVATVVVGTLVVGTVVVATVVEGAVVVVSDACAADGTCVPNPIIVIASAANVRPNSRLNVWRRTCPASATDP
jgi:hypothetical protein